MVNTYWGDYFIVHTNVESCTPETNIMLYVSKKCK